jgi:hypothetical protein
LIATLKGQKVAILMPENVETVEEFAQHIRFVTFYFILFG